MSTVVDGQGRHHHAAGSPASTGGRYAQQQAPAAAASLTLEAHVEPELQHSPAHRIARDDLDAFESKIAAANRRLARNGIDGAFTYTVEDDPVELNGRVYDCVAIELNQPKLSLAGWDFTGVHALTPAGAFVSTFAPGAQRNAPSDATCDHCGRRQARSKLFTVENADTGERAQVGSSCVATFLGVRPEGLWALEFDPLGDETTRRERIQHHRPMLHGETILLHALRLSDGGAAWVPQAEGTREQPSTLTQLRTVSDALAAEIDDDDRAEVAELVEWVDAIPADTDDPFLSKVRAALTPMPDGRRLVLDKHLGLAAAAVSAWHRDKLGQQRERERAREAATPVTQEWIGEPKQRIEQHGKVEITRVHAYEVNYGYRPQTNYLILMRDEQGRVLKWSTGSPPADLERGATMLLERATVKAHDEYEGDKQTSIIRAKLTPC